MDEEKFKIRSYGWTELALCYNPDLHPNSASRLLHRWVVRNEKLTRDLRAAGFCERQRKLTPKQVGVIVDFLGEPWKLKIWKSLISEMKDICFEDKIRDFWMQKIYVFRGKGDSYCWQEISVVQHQLKSYADRRIKTL